MLGRVGMRIADLCVRGVVNVAVCQEFILKRQEPLIGLLAQGTTKAAKGERVYFSPKA